MTCDDAVDLIVIGSGAAGLSAAVTAAHAGAKVLVLEKAPVIGGTTAWSGGWIWAPRNPLAIRDGIIEDAEAPATYLSHVLGNTFDAAKVNAFLMHAPLMVEFFETKTALQFESGSHIPDTYSDLPGAGQGGRSVIAKAYDGRGLGDAISRLRLPLPATAFMGMTIQAGADLRAFMTMTRSVASLVHVTKRFGGHLWDLAVHRRGMQLRNGNALIARLMRSALDAGVEIRTSVTIAALITEQERVVGVRLDMSDGATVISARRGVVLATGGAAQDVTRLSDGLDNAPRPLATSFSDSGGARLAQAVGAAFDSAVASPFAYCPVSEIPGSDGSITLFPHIIERGKPGLIGVLKNGKRFCNEGNGYHDYVTALLEATPKGGVAESWLIATRGFQRKYGLGHSRPSPVPLGSHLRSGYVKQGRTLRELAQVCGIDPDGLEQTVRAFNDHARKGEDPEFGRGQTAYNRLQGDAAQTPNPCVAPIEAGPFLAVRVVPGYFGAFAGLKTNESAQVLRPNGTAIAGLYAAGADMRSVFGGHYPAGGINLGPAMTFGFVAARHAVGAL
jgi:succinate dehydrogenase/fumarate reductase flavoprotein subunit